VVFKIFEGAKFEGGNVAGFENDCGSATGIKGFLPATGTKAPPVPLAESRKIIFRTGGEQIIAARLRELQEIVGHDRADRVHTGIPGAGATKTIAIETRARFVAAGLQWSAQNIRRPLVCGCVCHGSALCAHGGKMQSQCDNITQGFAKYRVWLLARGSSKGKVSGKFYPMPTVHIKTYGCQMNERDSDQVASMLKGRGFALVADETEADVILLNTCSVRDMAEQKALGKMGMLTRLRRQRPHLVLGYLGCMAQSRGEELLASSPGVDLVVGTQKFHRVAEYVEDLLRQRMESLIDDERRPIVDVEEEAGSQSTIRDHTMTGPQASAFVSIMQGCNMRCTFCIVPDTRGAERSRPIPEIVDEVRGLVRQGVKEVTLLGQIVNLYGRHEFPKVGGKSPFVQLIEAVHDVGGLERIRFTSPHPIGFRSDLIQALAELPKLMEHVHLPLQSGSDRILKRMHRGYTAAKYLALVEALRAARPDIAITTDIIVGFPGETEEDYQATRALCEQVDFDNAFIFRYSKRRDTPAAEMEEQLPEEVKEERNQDLLALINRGMERRLGELVGREVEILCEGPSRYRAERLTGRTRTNKIVVFTGKERHIGRIFPVRVVRASANTLYAEADLHQ
jgi:tRNA-2-methylthio-N6-dimethylallyladenosine synthase